VILDKLRRNVKFAMDIVDNARLTTIWISPLTPLAVRLRREPAARAEPGPGFASSPTVSA
jgi:hypothetical protein